MGPGLLKERRVGSVRVASGGKIGYHSTGLLSGGGVGTFILPQQETTDQGKTGPNPMLSLGVARRRTVLGSQGVIASLSDTFGLIKRNLKDIFIIWLLMVGIGFGWIFVALIVILPISLIAAVLFGGIPAALVYLISNSLLGAAIAGIPLALVAIILISSFGNGLYLVFRSSVWTLTYLEIDSLEITETQEAADGNDIEFSSPLLDPQPES